MRRWTHGLAAAAAAWLLGASVPLAAHHPIQAKFDESRPLSLSGLVTVVDWRNPHAHVFINVSDPGGKVENWAAELESPIDLQRAGWRRDSLLPGTAVTIDGIAARDGSRQVWARSIVLRGTAHRVLHVTPSAPPAPLQPRPTPRWPDGQPRLGPLPGGATGYWAHPTATALIEDGANVSVDRFGFLRNVTDASRVAPLQPWARALYVYRQSRFLRDDPMYLNCKPPGGPRQFQQPYGIQFVEDRERRRIFVLVGSGNSNYRIVYLDGRDHVGQVGGDDDNPLYYGRSVARWEGDTLVADTRSFNEDFWFSNGGLPHTDRLRLIERFSRPDFDTLTYEVTVEDPGAYTRPWSSRWTLRWVAGEELPVHLCQDNRP